MRENTTCGDSQPSSSTKPYLIRAIYQWALDNDYTPHLLITTDNQDVIIPRQYIQDGRIVLNIHPQSVTGLELGNEYLWFSTRFSGIATEITVPITAVLAIYVRENSHGIVFHDDDTGSISLPPAAKKNAPKQSKKGKKKQKPPHLKLVE